MPDVKWQLWLLPHFTARSVFDDVHIEGITKITAQDIKYAKEFDSVIKLIGIARNTESGIEACVYRCCFHLSTISICGDNSFNAVFVHGEQWTMLCFTVEARENFRQPVL